MDAAALGFGILGCRFPDGTIILEGEDLDREINGTLLTCTCLNVNSHTEEATIRCRTRRDGEFPIRLIHVYDTYYMTGVFPQCLLVDSWSRGVQRVMILHGVQFVVILTQGAIWRGW